MDLGVTGGVAWTEVAGAVAGVFVEDCLSQGQAGAAAGIVVSVVVGLFVAFIIINVPVKRLFLVNRLAPLQSICQSPREN